MNILFYNQHPLNPSCGGIERITGALTREFLNNGHNVFHLTAIAEKDLKYVPPVKAAVLPSRNKNLNCAENIEFYHKFLSENKIEIVINQNSTHKNGYISLSTPANSNIKKISVLHSNPIVEFSSLVAVIKFNSFESIVFSCLKILLFPLYMWNVRRKQTKHYSYLFKKSDKVCLLSERFYPELKSVYNKDRDKLVVIPNMNSYEAQEIDFSKKKKQVLFVGRLTYKDKRIDRLLKVWSYICNDNTDWELIIVGTGKEEKNLKNYVKKHNISSVRFEGHQNDSKKYIQEASIVCLVSSFEGFPMVLTESMVCGCVPFSFDSYQAVFDIIDSGDNGMIIPKFDIKEYANQLNKLMNNDDLREKMGKAAQKKIEMFSKENVICKWNKLLEEITL